PGKKLSVTGGTVSDTSPLELRLSGKAHAAGMGAGSKEHAKAVQFAPAGLNRLYIAIHDKAGNPSQQAFRAKALGLPAHGFSKRLSGTTFHSRDTYHSSRNRNPPAEMLCFHHNHTTSRPGQIQGGGQSGRPATDHHDIIDYFDILHTLQL